MESLRRRKSSAASAGPRPKASKQPAKLSKPANESRKSRVDDRIKKRMSMRYADISAPTSLVPAVPSIPTALRPGKPQERDDDSEIVQARAPSKEELKEAENKLLDTENFDPDAFLKLKMANSTEAELKTLQSSLQQSKDEVAVDLQRNVFKNYAEFVVISKEISTLENEMLELKESLAEWKSMPSVLHIDESTSAADRRRNVRSSIADLRVLYANQMQTLHAQIEGSTKFVPTTPGRHVVSEMDNIASLNAATYKPIHSVRFVLLDDAVLVARKRRRRNASESDKLVADRCWPLNEMLVLDTKDSPSLVNVFKVRHGKETHVYRTETAAEKKSLLGQFRQVAEELASKKRREREGEHERRRTVWTNDTSGNDWMADLAQQAGMTDGAKEKAERDALWIGDFADELTVAISLREWDRAAALVEEGEAKVAVTPALAPKLTTLTASLTSSLLQTLSNPNNQKATVVHLIHLLVRLRASTAARTTFLAARSEMIRKLVRMIRFEGHVGMYINDLAVVIFTAVKHTADWFLASFKENEVASSFIEWAKEQIGSFAAMFHKQVYSSDVDPKTVEEALKITRAQSRKLLQDYGLDFRFLLDELLQNPASKPIQPPTRGTSRAGTISDEPPRSTRSTPVPTARSRSPANGVALPTTSSIPPMPPIPSMSTSTPSRPTTPSARPMTPSARPTTPARPITPSARPITPSRPSTPSVSAGVPTASPTPMRSGAPNPLIDATRSSRSRGSPAPPPRSRDRPSSAAGQRPSPVSVSRSGGSQTAAARSLYAAGRMRGG
ncbi:hypothetical protein OF83DRAFT_1278659 [Amylostereum chailletii]|nr:hypothetical protein OF83DRAFT_1278659 [Amylostereum chailletii]